MGAVQESQIASNDFFLKSTYSNGCSSAKLPWQLLSFSLSLFVMAKPLWASLASCIREAYEDLEIIVLDNCCDSRTSHLLSECQDSRVVNARSEKHLSMTANIERGLHLAKGDYLCFIGDDDALMPNALERISNLTDYYNAPEPFMGPVADYWWPGTACMLRPNSYREGHVYHDMGYPSDKGMLNPEHLRHSFLRGSRNYRQLPGIYHKFVKRSALDKIKIGGHVFELLH